MRENKAMAIIMYGGDYPRMGALLDDRTIGSVPFAARYRLIDFVLSNLVHAGIWDIGIITRDKYRSLMEHLGSGRDWDLARRSGGMTLLPPSLEKVSHENYRGEIENLSHHQRYIQSVAAKYVVLTTADLVGPIDFEDAIERHAATGADITVLYKVAGDERDMGEEPVTLSMDGDERITEVAVGLPFSGPCLLSVGALVIEKAKLLAIISEMVAHSRYSIARDLLQDRCREMNIRGFRIDGGCVKIQTLDAYYRASMRLLEPNFRKTILSSEAPVLTRVRDTVPVIYRLQADVKNSLLADGCVIEGEVENCILFRNVRIARGAVVRNSILMQGTEVSARAELNYIIADRDCYIHEDRVLSGFSSYPIVIERESIV